MDRINIFTAQAASALVCIIASGCAASAPTTATGPDRSAELTSDSRSPQAEPARSAAAAPRGPYLGQRASAAPTLFAPGWVSTRHNELNAALSPDGRELFFSLTDPGDNVAAIMVSQQIAGVWSEPQVAPFSGQYSDVDPNFSPDGKRLYFCSTRPLTGDGPAKDADIWYVERTADGWSEAVNIGPPINTDKNDWYPSLTTDGTIYYSTWDPQRKTDDIFRARPTGDGGYSVENIGAPINTGFVEFDPFIAPDESYLLFASYRRDGFGSSDLYISINNDGQWSEPRNLGPEINSPSKDYCPVVSADGRYFLFTSKRPAIPYASAERKDAATLLERYDTIGNGLGNIYWMSSTVLGLPGSAGTR
ncbi:MAG: hypothetical protein AAGC55_13105 [Myxococcota bacterium]